jgi:AraC-like DNA-binding protein
MPQSIRQLELSATLGEWTLWTAEPCEALAPWVQEYWEVRGDIAAFREALLPNGRVELMFNLGPPHRVLDGAGAGEWTTAWYSGLQERAIHIETLHGTHLLSARLHPLAATSLFGATAPAAVNNIVPLERLLGTEAASLRAQLLATHSVEQHFATLEEMLLARRATATPVPPFVWEAVTEIERTHGRIAITTLHESLGMSRKHLTVSFGRAMGMSPKRYALTRRFIWTLSHLQTGQPIEWSTLAADAGYADQSHLVRDFRRVGAASPREYVRRVLPGATALLHDDTTPA